MYCVDTTAPKATRTNKEVLKGRKHKEKVVFLFVLLVFFKLIREERSLLGRMLQKGEG